MANQGSSESGYHFLQDYQKCRKFFQWKYLLQLEPKYTPTKLIYGRAIHRGLEMWYKGLAKKDPVQERVNAALAGFTQEMVDSHEEYMLDETYEEDLARGIEALRAYGIQNAMENWEVIGQPELDLSYVLPNGYRVTGRIDLVMRNPDGFIYIWDHKTTGWSLTSLTQTLQVSNQVNMHLLLWNKNFPGMPTTREVFNVIRQVKSVIEIKQILVIKTEQDILNYEQDACELMDEIAQRSVQPNQNWCMNTDSCYMFNRPCVYMNLCKGTAWQSAIGVDFKKRDRPPVEDAE